MPLSAAFQGLAGATGASCGMTQAARAAAPVLLLCVVAATSSAPTGTRQPAAGLQVLVSCGLVGEELCLLWICTCLGSASVTQKIGHPLQPDALAGSGHPAFVEAAAVFVGRACWCRLVVWLSCQRDGASRAWPVVAVPE